MQLIERGHDAVHVRDLGLDARPDREIAAAAAREDWALVTENVKDFAAEHDIVVVCVMKSHLPQQGMDGHLAKPVRLQELRDALARVQRDVGCGVHRDSGISPLVSDVSAQ